MKIICCLAIFLVMGCSNSITVLSAIRSPASYSDINNINEMGYDQSIKDWNRIDVILKSDQVASAMLQESTFYVNVSSCSEDLPSFPSVAFLGNVALDTQHRTILEELKKTNKTIKAQGYVPLKFIDKLDSICVSLRGGSYTGYSIKSNLYEVLKQQ